MSQKIVLFTLTCVALGAVAAHRFVGFDGAQVDTAGAKPLGVSNYAVPSGEAVPVDVHGTTKVTPGAAIPLLAKGLTPVKSDAQGRAIPHGGTGEIAGYAFKAAAAADGPPIEILLAL